MIAWIRKALAGFLAAVITIFTLGRAEVNPGGNSRHTEGENNPPISKPREPS